MKDFIFSTIISLALFIITALLFSSIFGFGSEANMNGWIETWILSIITTTFGLYYFKDKSSWKLKIKKIISNVCFLFIEISILVFILKVDLMYGALLVITIPLFLSLNKILIDKILK